MLALKPKTTMFLSGPFLSQAEAVTIMLFDMTKQSASGSKKAKAAADTILPMLASRKFVIEKNLGEKDPVLRMSFVDYSTPEVDEDFRRYAVNFYVEGENLCYIVYDHDDPIISDYWTIQDLQQITEVHTPMSADHRCETPL